MSILLKSSPRDVRFIMIDLKMLELSLYDDLPHLLVPVVTDPKKAAVVLKNLVEQRSEWSWAAIQIVGKQVRE